MLALIPSSPGTARFPLPPSADIASPRSDAARSDYWQGLQARTNRLLRNPRAPSFITELRQLQGELTEQLERQPDRTLLALVHLSSTSTLHYSATHALLCAAAAALVARQLTGWTGRERQALVCAALTMNVWMTALQDELANQPGAPSAAQRTALEGHARGAARLLAEIGVDDADWLDAVAHHHDAASGPLAPRPKSQQMARVLQRIDLFTARLSPRRSRRALSAAAAAQAAYHGEDGLPDEAGMLLIRAIGLYPPGCRVRLVNGEAAVVLRRGTKAHSPMVAAIADAGGQALRAPALCRAARPEHAVRAALAPHDMLMPLPFGRLLALAAA